MSNEKKKQADEELEQGNKDPRIVEIDGKTVFRPDYVRYRSQTREEAKSEALSGGLGHYFTKEEVSRDDFWRPHLAPIKELREQLKHAEEIRYTRLLQDKDDPDVQMSMEHFGETREEAAQGWASVFQQSLARAITSIESSDEKERADGILELFQLGRAVEIEYALTNEKQMRSSVKASVRAHDLNESAAGRATGAHSSAETLTEIRCRLFDQYQLEHPAKKAADIHRMIADHEIACKQEPFKISAWTVTEIDTGREVKGDEEKVIRHAAEKKPRDRRINAIKQALKRKNKKKA